MYLYAYAFIVFGIACGTMVACIAAGYFDGHEATRPEGGRKP